MEVEKVYSFWGSITNQIFSSRLHAGETEKEKGSETLLQNIPQRAKQKMSYNEHSSFSLQHSFCFPG